MQQRQAQPEQLTAADQEFISHTKSSILDSNATPFEVSNFPKNPSSALCKEFLDVIYKTVKSNKSSDSNKSAALKILKSSIVGTKSTLLIKLFLSCQMWTFFCEQYRAYFKNGKQSSDPKYSENYFQFLEYMLETFKQDLGIDNNNRETPFLKFWNAVHRKNFDKQEIFSYFVALISNLQFDKPETVERIKSELRGFELSNEYHFRIKTFLRKFQEKTANLAFIKSPNPTFENTVEFKREFHSLCEKEFYFGDCEAKHYDLFLEILELEEEKLRLMNSPLERPGPAQVLNEAELNLSRLKVAQPPVLNERQSQSKILEKISSDKNERQLQKERPSAAGLLENSNRSIYSKINPPENFEPPQNVLPVPVLQNLNEQSLNKSLQNSKLGKYKIFENSLSANKQAQKGEPQQILNISQPSKLNISSASKQNVDAQGRTRTLMEVSRERIDKLMRLPFPALKRLKSFSYVRRGSLLKNELLKIGVQVYGIKETSDKRKFITLSCFYEEKSQDSPKIEIEILSAQQIEQGTRKTAHKFEIDMLEFCRFGDYPFASVSFDQNGRISKQLIEIFVPINKFISVLKVPLEELNLGFSKAAFLLATKFYRLDYNFFRRGFEFLFLFKNLWPLDVEQRNLGGIVELVGLQEKFAMKILIDETRQFKIEVYYGRLEDEQRLKAFLEEMVVLFADRDSL